MRAGDYAKVQPLNEPLEGDHVPAGIPTGVRVSGPIARVGQLAAAQVPA
jgi:hypothetical protein